MGCGDHRMACARWDDITGWRGTVRLQWKCEMLFIYGIYLNLKRGTPILWIGRQASCNHVGLSCTYFCVRFLLKYSVWICSRIHLEIPDDSDENKAFDENTTFDEPFIAENEALVYTLFWIFLPKYFASWSVKTCSQSL